MTTDGAAYLAKIFKPDMLPDATLHTLSTLGRAVNYLGAH